MISGEMLTICKIVLSAALMFVLGKERQEKKRFIGPRTLMLMGFASTLFSSIALQFNNLFVLGGVMTGVGFLGGGVIVKEKGKVGGLTTAALIWMAAAIGICIGLELYVTAIFSTIFSFLVLRSKGKFLND